MQISRLLNPYTIEDAGYLAGLPAGEIHPPAGYEWLGVFLLALNPTDHPLPSASSFQLSDTQKVQAGAGPDVVRLSIGIEDKDDIIADLDQGLADA